MADAHGAPSWEEALEAELERRHAENLFRRRHVIDGPQGAYVQRDGRRLLAFCSNDYLGLAAHPRLSAALRRAADGVGVGSGASHLVCGHMREHYALEEELAAFLGRPRALVFSTGYMANLGAVGALVTRGDVVAEDRLNHASLLDAAVLSRARLRRYRHGDALHLAQVLGSGSGTRQLVATDGVFSMDGDLAPVPELVAASRRHRAWLMVDDAHGIGVLGPDGAGTLAHYGLGAEEVPILVGTFGKALGTFGAFVAGPEAMIETLVQHARTYIYTTALPAPVAAATRASLRLLTDEGWRRLHLEDLVIRFRERARAEGLPVAQSPTPIQPIVTGDAATAVSVSERLEQRGILVPAIRPPTVARGQARLRVTLSAAHTTEEVDRLVEALAEAMAEQGRERRSGGE